MCGSFYVSIRLLAAAAHFQSIQATIQYNGQNRTLYPHNWTEVHNTVHDNVFFSAQFIFIFLYLNFFSYLYLCNSVICPHPHPHLNWLPLAATLSLLASYLFEFDFIFVVSDFFLHKAHNITAVLDLSAKISSMAPLCIYTAFSLWRADNHVEMQAHRVVRIRTHALAPNWSVCTQQCQCSAAAAASYSAPQQSTEYQFAIETHHKRSILFWWHLNAGFVNQRKLQGAHAKEQWKTNKNIFASRSSVWKSLK